MVQLNDSKLTVLERLGNVGLGIGMIPFLVTGHVIQISSLMGALCVSPVVGTIEYIVTGKMDGTRITLNVIADIDRMIINSNVDQKYQMSYRNIF